VDVNCIESCIVNDSFIRIIRSRLTQEEKYGFNFYADIFWNGSSKRDVVHFWF